MKSESLKRENQNSVPTARKRRTRRGRIVVLMVLLVVATVAAIVIAVMFAVEQAAFLKFYRSDGGVRKMTEDEIAEWARTSGREFEEKHKIKE